MANASGYKAVLRRYGSCSAQVQWYFDQFPRLLQSFTYEVTLAYLFLRTSGTDRALYCGVVKLREARKDVADTAVSVQHVTRDYFPKLYENIFAHPMKKTTREKIEKAEKNPGPRDSWQVGGSTGNQGRLGRCSRICRSFEL